MKKQTIKNKVLASIVVLSMLFGNTVVSQAKSLETAIPQATNLSIMELDSKVTALIELSEEPIMDDYLDIVDRNDDREELAVNDYISSRNGKCKIRSMLKRQDDILKMIEKKVDCKLLYRYTTVFNGFAVEINRDGLEFIKGLKGVKRAFLSTTYETLETESTNNKALDTLKDSLSMGKPNYEGKGIIVSIIDTGVDVTHSAFSNTIESPKLTKEELGRIINQTSLNALGIDQLHSYISDKIPFAYDYADHDRDVNPTEQSLKMGNGHGTNVAGLIGAKCEDLDGIAPQAQLLAMKVYDDAKGKAKTENILAAIEDSITLGADIINMSLGTASGFSEAGNEAVEEVYDSVEKAGINLLVAAGNAGSSSMNNGLGNVALTGNPDLATVYSPSTYTAAVSVANVSSEPDYISSWGTSPNLDMKPEISAPGKDVFTTAANNTYTVATGTSISAPIVAGSYAILREYISSHPVFSKMSRREQAELATNLLMSTAIPGSSQDGILFSPRRQGSGIINVQNALATKAYLYTDKDVEVNLKPKLNLYDDYQKKGEFSSVFHLYNISDKDTTYHINFQALADDIIPFEEFQEMMVDYPLSERVDILKETSKAVTDLVDFEVTVKNAMLNKDKLTVRGNSDAEVFVKFKLKEELNEYYNTYFPNGGFFEGYILFETEESGCSLSIPYVGFYGDWTSAPLFDSGSAYNTKHYSQTFHVAYTNGGNAYLGINPFDQNMYYFLNNKYNPLYMQASYNEYALEPDPNKIAISPNGDGNFDALDFIQLSQLRNAKNISVKITKEDGEVIKEQDAINVPKSIFRSNYRTVKPTLIESVFDGENCKNNDVVTIKVNGNIDYDRHESHNVCDTYEMNVAVDLEKPALENAVITENEEGEELTVTVQDNQYVSYIAIYQMNSENGIQMMDASFVNEEDRNKLTTLTFDISEYSELFENKGDIMIVLYDYAMNQSNFVFEKDGGSTKVIHKYFDSDYEVEFSIDRKWDNRFAGKVKIKNTSDKVIRNWALQFKPSYRIEEIWNAAVQFQKSSGYAVEGQTWNQSIGIGEEVEFGFIAHMEGEIVPWEWYQLISYEDTLDEAEYNVQVKINSEWNNGYRGEIFIRNCSDKRIKEWNLEFDSDSELKLTNTNHQLFHKERHYAIGSTKYHPNLEKGETIVIEFIGTGSAKDFENFRLKCIKNNFE